MLQTKSAKVTRHLLIYQVIFPHLHVTTYFHLNTPLCDKYFVNFPLTLANNNNEGLSTVSPEVINGGYPLQVCGVEPEVINLVGQCNQTFGDCGGVSSMVTDIPMKLLQLMTEGAHTACTLLCLIQCCLDFSRGLFAGK